MTHLKTFAITLALALAGILPAFAAPAFVTGQDSTFTPNYTSATSFTASLTNVNPNSSANDAIVCSFETTSATAPSSVSDSVNGAMSVALAWGGGTTSNLYLGVWYILDPTAGDHVITVSFSASEFGRQGDCIEVSGLASSSPIDAAPAIASGYGTAITATAAAPTSSSDFAFVALNSLSSATWGGSLTGLTGPDAYQVLTSTSAFTATATNSSANSWAIGVVLFKPASGGSTCTHAGWETSASGALAVPNGTSGLYWGKNGALVTPDCSTVEYWQPKRGNFGVN